MFDQKKLEMLEKRCKTLQEDNVNLHKRVKELEHQLKDNLERVDAAMNYADEHRLAMRTLSQSRERYDLAYKQMLKIKKEYEKRMEKVLKSFE